MVKLAHSIDRANDARIIRSSVTFADLFDHFNGATKK